LAYAAHAQNTITFDDQGWNSNQLIDSNFTTGNFLFSSNENFYTNYGYNFDVYSVSIYFAFQNPAEDQITVTTINNELVTINSIAAYQVSEASTDTLIIEGWNGDSKEYTRTFSNITTWQILTLDFDGINKVIFKLANSGYNGLTDFNFDNFSFNETVPVELVEFKGRIDQNSIILEWRTATELNNYGFDIERNVNEKGWEKIGFVKGHGNSDTPQSYSFIDKNLIGGGGFQYRLKKIDTDGNFEYSDLIEIEFTAKEFVLFQNYPNPFNPSTKISYTIAPNSKSQMSKVVLKVYDILGNEVTTLVDEEQEAGSYSVSFDAGNLSSGIYVYKLIAEGFVSNKKMMLIK
jgi:hypothetical protein